MRLSNQLDYYVKRARRYSYVLGNKIRDKNNGGFWSKYHELYLKGEFNSENRKRFLEEWFVSSMGYFPDIENPKTFNEKIQWYKLYYNHPLIVKCIDKISFKDYLKETLGDENVIPLLGVYLSADEIDFSKLPDQFVIKANFGSDGKEIILVTDKSKLAKRYQAGKSHGGESLGVVTNSSIPEYWSKNTLNRLMDKFTIINSCASTVNRIISL
jgi:hypothetical protein